MVWFKVKTGVGLLVSLMMVSFTQNAVACEGLFASPKAERPALKLVTARDGQTGFIPEDVRVAARKKHHAFRDRVASRTSERETRILTLPEIVNHLHDLMEIYEAHGQVLNFRIPYFFGRPIDQALRDGYQITNFGFFERIPRPVAQAVAGVATQMVSGCKEKTQYDVADLFAGTGRNTVAFATRRVFDEPMRVFAVEKDELTAQLLMSNLSRFNYERANSHRHRLRVDVRREDAFMVLHRWMQDEVRVGALYIDLPWFGADFRINQELAQGRSADLGQVIRDSFEVTSNLILKLPTSYSLAELNEIARKMRLEISSRKKLGVMTVYIQRIYADNVYSVRDDQYLNVQPRPATSRRPLAIAR